MVHGCMNFGRRVRMRSIRERVFASAGEEEDWSRIGERGRFVGLMRKRVEEVLETREKGGPRSGGITLYSRYSWEEIGGEKVSRICN